MRDFGITPEELGSDGILLLEQSPALQGAVEIYRCAKALNERRERKMRENPKLCDDDFHNDVRYMIGFTDALQWVLSLPVMARDYKFSQIGGTK